jgi:hypothetical protein
MGIELGAKNLYKAYGVPSLDLTFADKKSLVDRISGNNLITFTRSSTATYVGADGLIQSAASGAARFDHNPTTGESLGLLVEEARTNLVTYSEQLDNGAWSKFEVTVTANATTAPDNTTTADSVLETTNATQHRFDTPTTSVTSGTAYTFSLFLKPNGRDVVTLQTKGIGTEANGIYTLTGNGVVSGFAGGGTGTISKLPNGWYRCTLTATASASGTGYGRVFLQTNATVGGVGVFAWGAQMEVGAFPTSYIPTTTATVTRAADVASITGANFSSWYNQSEGSFIVNERNSYAGGALAKRFELNQDSSPNANAIAFSVNNSNGTRISTRASNAAGTLDVTLSNVWASGGSHKFGYALQLNNSAAASSSSIATDSACTLPPDLDSLSFGATARAASLLNPAGKFTLSRITYYPVRLPDATLQALTQ